MRKRKGGGEENNCQGEKHKFSDSFLQTVALQLKNEPNPHFTGSRSIFNRALSVHFNIKHVVHGLGYLSTNKNTMLCRLSLKVILYKNNMHMLLKRFATVLRIKIHHRHSYIQKTAMFSVCKFGRIYMSVYL